MLILKGNIVYTKNMDKFEVHKNSYIVVKDTEVEGIYEKLPKEYEQFEVVDYEDKLIIPSFVDMHLHAAQFLQCGMGMDKHLLEWLKDYTFKLERKFQDEEFAREIYTKFADELIKNGTLRACIFASSSTQGTEILFEILKKKKIGAYVGKVSMDRNAPKYIIEENEKSIKDTIYLIEKYKDEPLVKPIITPRFAITSTEKQLKDLGDLALKYNLPVQSHLSEDISEVEYVKKLFPKRKSYSQVYNKHNLFGQTKTIMAHCIYLSEEELELAKENDVMFVHCPDSNMNLGSGMMPAREYLNRGIKVALGSDIAGGHKIAMNYSVVRAIQTSKMVALKNKDQKPLSMSEAFYMATKSGGSFFGKVGSFEKDYKFDALIIEDDEVIKKIYSIEDRLERFMYIGRTENIVARYLEGKKIEI